MPLNKERGSRMKRLVCILLAAMTALSLAACQKTPEEVIVVKKDMERMVEQANQPDNGNPMDTLDIPEGQYIFSATGLDGRLRINVDANIERPDAQAMPIVRVEQGGFSQELVTKIFDCLFAGKTAFESGNNVIAKGEAEKFLLEAKQRLGNGSYAAQGYTEDEYKSLIAKLEEQYKNAPAAVPESPVSNGDMALKNIENVGDYLSLDVSTKEESQDGTYRTLSVSTPFSQAARQSGFGTHLFYNYYPHGDVPPNYNTQGIVRIDSDADLPEEVRRKLTIGIDKARSMCDGFFSSIGLPEIRFGYAFLVGDWGAGMFTDDGREMGAPAENFAYRLYYTRFLQGVSSFVNMNWGLRDDDSSMPWSYECICFTVNNDGIVSIDWHNPINALETVQESSAMKPFDQIMGVFETMVKTEYEAFVDQWTDGRGEMDIDISAIQFCLVRVREPNVNNATGLMVPAWVFYGNNEMIYDDGHISYDSHGGSASSWNKEPFPILIVNAIDGSIIDLSKGY